MYNFDESRRLGLIDNGSGLITDLQASGQLGYGIKPGALDGATPLVLPPAIIYVTQTPAMWDGSDEGVVLSRVVKSMFETHARSVTGIEIGYTLESGQGAVGHDGQQMDAPTVSKRAAVNPSITYGEITGNLVFRVHQTWIWDIADPDTQISLARIPEADVLPFTMSTYALSFIALQFDQTYTADRLLGAIYITNVYPQGTGDFGLKREIATANVQERPITYTGLAIENEYIYNLGKSIAADLGLHAKGNYFNPASPYEGGFGARTNADAAEFAYGGAEGYINAGLKGNPDGSRQKTGILDETTAYGQGNLKGEDFEEKPHFQEGKDSGNFGGDPWTNK